jgi:hypothetical protein
MALRRELTNNEIKFVRHVFRDSVSIENTEVIMRAQLSGGFTPYGGIKMGPTSYAADYIGPDMYNPPGAPDFDLSYLFLHELGHSWQHFCGAPMLHLFIQARAEGRRSVKSGGVAKTAFNREAATYSYAIIPTKPDLLDYNMEQQCEIIADYFSHTMWGRMLQINQWGGFGLGVPTLPQLEGVMRRFLEDPAYPKRDRGMWRARSWARNLDR